MVAIWIKLFLIALAGVGALFGATEVFKFKGEEGISELSERIPPNIGDDIKKLGEKTPWEDIRLFISGGVGGIVKFFLNVINTVLGWVFYFIKPGMIIPKWFGWVVIIFIGSLLLWKGVGHFFDWATMFGKWLTLIVGLIFGVAIVLMFMGVL